MDIIFVSNGRGGCRRWQCRQPTVIVFFLAVFLGAAYLSYVALNLIEGPDAVEIDTNDHAVETGRAEQQEALNEAVRNSRNHLDALAMRLAELQARVSRLESLGARVVDATGLDPQEFSFGRKPAIGGPANDTSEPISVPDFISELQELANAVVDRGVKLTALEGLLSERELVAKMIPSGRPVGKGWISSGYGYRTDPTSGERTFHEGVDFAGVRRSNVIAVAAGVVVFSGRNLGYGKMIAVKHRQGYVSRYAHNAKNLVEVGETVAKGQPIALMGSTGRATGPHVHFEVLRMGRAINPMDFVRHKG